MEKERALQVSQSSMKLGRDKLFKMKNAYFFMNGMLIVLVIVVAVIAGYFFFSSDRNDVSRDVEGGPANAGQSESIISEPADESSNESETLENTSPVREIILPSLTYPDAYNGPLYATSEQIGDNYPIGKYMANLDKNGVNWFIGFFTFAEPQENLLNTRNGLGYVITAVKRYPGRIIPYYNPGIGGEEAESLVGDELTSRYSATLSATRKIVGQGFIKGLGEIEVQEWGVAHNSPKVLQIFDLAQANDINAMFHPVASKITQVAEIAKKYPNMKFIIHMYRSDLDKSRSQLIEILKTYDNIYYSIDAAHIAHTNNRDIVYDLERNTLVASKSAFITEFDSEYNKMLAAAVSDYKPLVEAVPDKVMWGTEMGPDYSYEPEVYDRMIKISRELIGKMKPEHQEAFGYKNALRFYGEGLIYNGNVNVFDTSGWPNCNDSQIDECDAQCGATAENVEDPEIEKCFLICLATKQCIEVLEQD